MAKSLPPLGSAAGAVRAAAWPICRSRVPIVLLVYRQMGQKSGPHVPKSADGKAPGEQLMLAGRVCIGMPIKEVALRVSLLGHAAQNRGVMWTTGAELAAFRAWFRY